MNDKQQELLNDLKNQDRNYLLGDFIYDKEGEYLGSLEEKIDHETQEEHD